MSRHSGPLAEFTVPAELDGERIDRAVPAGAPAISRTKARTYIEGGSVFVDQARVRVCSRAVRTGQRITVYELAPEQPPPRAGEEPRVLFSNADLAVVAKPARMPVEPTRQGARGTLEDWLKKGVEGGGFITHRLDAPTSGVIVVARTKDAQAELNRMFAGHEISRSYLTAVSPAPSWDTQTIDGSLDGKPAVTHAKVLERSPKAALLRVELETGRTRQIRRHLAGIGHPVVGDLDAGGSVGAIRASRLLLHAAEVEFKWRGQAITVKEPVPQAWLIELDRLGFTNSSPPAPMSAN